MAVNKSKSNYWLTAHVAVYSVWMIPLGYYLLGDSIRVIMFDWINFSLHWIIDFITSRINSKLWAAGQTHYFFVSVGFDQLLHYACLFGTLTILTKVL
jgi:uncharacterized membrane protein YjjP (DUF1212 family)